MPHDGTTPAPAEEIAQLREEVRRLREEQKRQRQAPAKPEQEPPSNDEPQKEEKKPHPVRKFILIAVGVVVLVAGILWYLNSRHYETTDDAQVDGRIGNVPARIAGTVTGVYIDENQPVKAGQLVADLDPRDYQAAMEQARGQWLQAQAETQAEQPNVPLTQVSNQTAIATTQSGVTGAEAAVAAAERDYEAALQKVREAEANNAKAQADVARYRPLAEKDEVPREQFDQVVANARALAANVAASQATAAGAQKQVEQRQAQLAESRQKAEEARSNAPHQISVRRFNVATRQAATAAARAQFDQAVLNLSYCKITAPVDGIVAKRSVEVGYHVSPGQQLFLVTQSGETWVTANFRETQLRRIRPGQSVRIKVDALGSDFQGRVESMPAATGAVTSLLPPENASGNFVKVTQRLPVRIRFDKDQPGLDRLRPGMSVEPKVRVE